MGDIILKKGEGKWIEFLVKKSGVPVNLSGESFQFAVKNTVDDTSYLLLKSGESFNTANATIGRVKVNVTSAETTSLGIGNFVSALKIVFEDGTDIDLSNNIPFLVRSSVFHD